MLETKEIKRQGKASLDKICNAKNTVVMRIIGSRQNTSDTATSTDFIGNTI